MLTTIGLSDEYAPLIASGILTLGDLAIGRGYANVGSAFAKSSKGWKVGDSIRNSTRAGNTPSWSAVRQRYWKNEAASHSNSYTEANLARMKKGRAPLVFDKKTGTYASTELHHNPPQREGGLFEFIEVTPSEHAALDPKRYLRR